MKDEREPIDNFGDRKISSNKMYVTRPLSLYKKFPASLSLPPPEGPNSGYLVIQDEESETTACFGLCKRDGEILELPIPQNNNHIVRHSNTDDASHDHVIFIPVLNQPLSSNRYYAIKARGNHAGEAYKNSNEEDMGICCFCNVIQDVKPISLDPRNLYQQFEICYYKISFPLSTRKYFTAKSVAPDGFPPHFLRRKGWEIQTKTPKNYKLGEAAGLDTALRARLPEFNFPLSYKTSQTIVVGKWYCPFMFIKEGTLNDQMKRSMYYEMTLEQRWEQIFACENNNSIGNAVAMDVFIQREVVSVAGREAVHDARNVVDGVKWFQSGGGGGVGGEVSVGLRLEIVERMKWEQERAGWVGEENKQVRVERVEEFEGGNGGWQNFGCYVLVERFVLKRMDGSLVLTHDFKHTHQIKSKWD